MTIATGSTIMEIGGNMGKIDEFTFLERYPYVLYDVSFDTPCIWITDIEHSDSEYSNDISSFLNNLDLLEMIYPNALAAIKRIEGRFRRIGDCPHRNYMYEQI